MKQRSSENDDKFDLEPDWQTLRPEFEAETRETFLERILNEANEVAVEKLRGEFTDRALTVEALVDSIGRSVQVFIDEWFKALRAQDRAGLIEVIIDEQNLSPSEMRGFVRSLPLSFLNNAAKSAFTGASGIHALLSVEYSRRAGIAKDFTIRRVGSRVQVTVRTSDDKKLQFFLDDSFEIDPMEAVTCQKL
jgi:hypothetical protein